MLQESVLAAIAVCAADEDQLTSFGAADLLKAAQSASTGIGTDAQPSSAAEGTAPQNVDPHFKFHKW